MDRRDRDARDAVADLDGFPLAIERAERVHRRFERAELRGVAIDALVSARRSGLGV